MPRWVWVPFVLLTACVEDTKASSKCVGAGSMDECKHCCSTSNRHYFFQESHTTKRCMCKF
jgi:hypothetical protein